MKRSAYLLIGTLVLMVLLGASAIAQTVTQPDEGVKGAGAIYTSAKNIGTFDINVGRTGTALIGGFKYTDASPTGIRSSVIYSKELTGLKIVGNTATITAVGYWNSMTVDITVEVLDDLNMDWFHIVAKPRGMVLIMPYEQSGGLIKGDVVVYSKPAPSGFVKGAGTIAVKTDIKQNAGRFQVYAEKSGNVIKGSIYYYEYNPLAASIIERPIVKIYVPIIDTLYFSGATAVMKGKGTLNGRTALVEVTAKDNNLPWAVIPMNDEFYIKANTVSATEIYDIFYQAGGPLTSGDVTVKTNVVTTR